MKIKMSDDDSALNKVVNVEMTIEELIVIQAAIGAAEIGSHEETMMSFREEIAEGEIKLDVNPEVAYELDDSINVFLNSVSIYERGR